MVPASLRAPESGGALGQVLLSLLVTALLLLLIAFPAELFNSTVEDNYVEIVGWFAWITGHTRLIRARIARMPASAGFVLFGVAAGFILSFLDPSFGFNLRSLALALGLVAAVFTITLAAKIPTALFARHLGLHGRLRSFPPATIIAVLCVTISRLLHFVPGYAFGLTAGYQPTSGELSRREEGEGVAMGSTFLLFFCMIMWFVWGPIDRAAARANPSFGLLFADAMLAGIVIAGIGGLVFSLMPLRFCDGDKVRRWSKKAWTLLFGSSIFAFILIIPAPSPTNGTTVGSVVKAVAVFLTFAFGSIAFWAYFRFRQPRLAPAGAPASGSEIRLPEAGAPVLVTPEPAKTGPATSGTKKAARTETGTGGKS